MSLHLQRQISHLKEMILTMGTLVEEAVAGAIRAIETRDMVLARTVIEKDSEIDLMEIDIEEECLKILALHQPVANDLRYIIGVLKIKYPPGFNTRYISRSARNGSGTCSKTSVQTTVSKLASPSGMSVAEPTTSGCERSVR